MTTKWKRWTSREREKMFAAVDRGDHWDDIALALKRTAGACQVQYSLRKAPGTPTKRRGRRSYQSPAAVAVPPARPPSTLMQAAPAPSRAQRISTASLIADAELRTRIELQGITAGLMGDPLPGRSALDERRGLANG